MKRMCVFSLCAAWAGVFGVLLFADSASAYYHPGLGRWMSRDPGAGGEAAPRVGTTGSAVGGGFLPRDQYVDGMNLYQYVNSAPAVRVDPLGLEGTDCGVKVHRIFPKTMENMKTAKSEIGHTWLEYNGKTVGFAPGGIYSPDVWHENPGPDKSWDAPVDSSAWFRRMKKGSGAEKKCACVTCEEVYDCLDKVAEEWKVVKWNFETANCRDFVRAASDACCLNYPIRDHLIRWELRALTIIGFGPLGALIPLPEIEEGDI